MQIAAARRRGRAHRRSTASGALVALWALFGLCRAADVDELGADRYAEFCAACHGPEALGGQGPSLIDPTWRHGDDDASVARSIRQGFPPSMSAFGDILSEREIDAVVAFLRKARAGPVRSPTRLPLGYQPSGVPKGVVRTEVHDFRVEINAEVGIPYGFDFLPDGRILITEIAGTLRIVEGGRLLPQPVADVPISDFTTVPGYNKRGMLDVIVHPDYRANGWIYLTTARGHKDANGDDVALVSITRGRVREGRWTDGELVLAFHSTSVNAMRMAFDGQGFLYIGVPTAEGRMETPTDQASSQDLSTASGKILRMTDDGRVPDDNPFVGHPGAYPYIFSYGHRAPLALAFDGNGELWGSENGPRGGDELNHIRAGANYGWPVITWGHPYDARLKASHTEHKGMEQPVISFVPSPAISALTFYNGEAFPRWKNNALLGSLKQMDLFRIALDGERMVLQETILHGLDRIRDVGVDPQGYVHVLTDGGLFVRLAPSQP